MPGLSVHVSRDYGTVVLHPHGALDFDSAPVLDRAAGQVQAPFETLTVDMSQVPFIDSAGLHVLVTLRNRCEARQCHMAVTGLQPQGARLLELTGLTDFFHTAA